MRSEAVAYKGRISFFVVEEVEVNYSLSRAEISM